MTSFRTFTKAFLIASLVYTSASGQGTIIDSGSPTNKWLLHNPEDSRKTLFIAPWYNGNWDFSQQTQFRPNGDVTFSGRVAIGTNQNVSAATRLDIYGDFRTTTGRFSSIYSQNTDGSYPGNVINTPGDAQLSIGANWSGGSSDLSLINSNIANTQLGGFSFWQMTDAQAKRNLVYFQGNGNVGIGNMSPLARLHIGGGGLVLGSNAVAQNTDGHLSLGDVQTSSTPTAQNWGTETALLLNAQDYTTIGFHDSGNRVDYIRSGNGTIQVGYDGGWGPANVGLPSGVWNASGNVGIGTLNPGTYRLAVEGKIGAREVEVKTGSWADFVFAADYQLPTLEEVETHIKVNQHLPGIPTTAEVVANGIALGQMNTKLLQKIEELTLYAIEQQKRIQTLECQMKLVLATKARID